MKIKTWKQFAKKVRSRGCNLLDKIENFQEPILVTGCQRSGTTILSRVITQSDGMVNFQFSKDDELDAALILAGQVSHKTLGRYCFQTTYVNECYEEYFSLKNDFKMIWVIRNPDSVIHSLIYNWRRWALNELFRACGAKLLDDRMAERYKRFGVIAVPPLLRACYSYLGKISQLYELNEALGPDILKVIDYDDLVLDKGIILKGIFDFINIPFKTEYTRLIHSKSINNKMRLKNNELNWIKEICLPAFGKAKTLCH